VYNFAERMVDSREGSISEHLCKLSSCCNLEEDLDLIQRLSVGRVKAESAIFVLIRSNIDVAVIVVVERQVPVSALVSF
jgi:hypothetical protein